MKKLLITVIVLLVLAAAFFGIYQLQPVNDVVFEFRCKHLLEPATVTVQSPTVEFSVDKHMSIVDLTRQYPPKYEGMVLGITKANLAKGLSIDNTGFEQAGTGRICARPKVKVTLSFNPMTVFIASNFPENSCKYNEVYAHEIRHVEAYKAFLSKVSLDVNGQLTGVLGEDVYYFKNKEDAKLTMDTLIENMWMPYLTAKLEQVAADQEKIDTYQEYDRLTHTCGG